MTVVWAQAAAAFRMTPNPWSIGFKRPSPASVL